MDQPAKDFLLGRKLAKYTRVSDDGCLLWIGAMNRGGNYQAGTAEHDAAGVQRVADCPPR